jgi:predicted nucleic acid-binding protein
MTVVCDTGPVLHLLEADALELLNGVGTVFVPPAVNGELERLTPHWPARRPAWLTMQDLNAIAIVQAVEWRSAGLLHEGEAQALALALAIQADWFLTDDAAVRVFAVSLGLETHGSLGVVLWCAGQAQLDQPTATTKLEALFRSSLWISMRVQAGARRALSQIYR